jgi:hypothetical protein
MAEATCLNPFFFSAELWYGRGKGYEGMLSLENGDNSS